MRGRVRSVACVLGLVLIACGGDDSSSGSKPGPDSGPSDSGSNDSGKTCSGDDDCSKGPCRTSVCSAGECKKNDALDGTPTPEQTAGDCSQVVCNADGTTRTEADDTDVPAAAGECSTPGCAAGAKTSEPKAAATACTGGLCDGAGTCVAGVGVTCSKADDCPSKQCVDGVCCNEACTGTCKSCGVDGKKGICSNVPYYKEDLASGGVPETCSYAVAGAFCDGEGNCKKVSGTTCNADANCMSGKCNFKGLKCLGTKGEMCNAHADCVSGTCSGGACM